MIKVVVSEDFDILREEIVEILSMDEDIEVVADFSRGDETVKYVLENPVDVVLMDIDMESPKAGIAACEEIYDEKSDTKVIFLTAYEVDDIVMEAMGVGGIDYICKENFDKDLVTRVKNGYSDKVSFDLFVTKTLRNEYRRLRYSEKSLLFFINNVGKLTPAEIETMSLILDNKTNKEIAADRNVEMSTVKSQVRAILNKFGCSTKKEVIGIIKDLKLEYLFSRGEK